MESISSSIVNTPLPSSSSAYSSFNLTSNKRIGFLKLSDTGSNFGGAGLRIHSLARQLPSEESEDKKALNNGFGLLSGDNVSLSQVCNFSFIVLFILFLLTSECSVSNMRKYYNFIDMRTLRYVLMLQFCVHDLLHVCLILI